MSDPSPRNPRISAISLESRALVEIRAADPAAQPPGRNSGPESFAAPPVYLPPDRQDRRA
jgi:hypothetical protein